MKVIKIGAEWCSGCLVMRPRWQKVEDEMPELKTEYYDYDNDKKKMEQYGVDGGRLPCFIWLDKDGQEIERVTGEPSVKKLMEIIQRNKDK
ncbi:MAG: thioredoxin family protein [Candidatus Beckwithbacteria bacterium]|nr:thioredoxin family protein [Patescibacteria group bacterium]